MADTDTSSYLLRYNLVSQAPEYFAGADWYSVSLPPGDLPLANTKILVGNASGLAAAVSLSGGATISNAGVLTLTSTAVTGAVLTNYSSGAGTLAATDTILQGFNKLNGNIVAGLADTAITGKLLTGYTSGAGTVAATDTILQGINKLNGNTALKATAGAVGSSGLTQNTGKLLGRTTASAGAIEEIAVGTGLDLSAGTLSNTSVGSGVINSGTNLHLAFYDGDGTTLTRTVGAVINAAGYIVGTMPQIIQKTDDTDITVHDGDGFVTIVSQAITPLATTHKIRLHCTIAGDFNSVSGTMLLQTQILRDATIIFNCSRAIVTPDRMGLVIPFEFLDAPATTSSRSYTVQVSITNGTGTMEFNASGSDTGSVLILEELAY